MKQINGHVFIAGYPEVEYLFGRAVNRRYKSRDYESFQTNGLTPYKYLWDAHLAGEKYARERADVKAVTLAGLKMEIAENEKELERFEGKTSLVVIMNVDEHGFKENRLLGPAVERKPNLYHLPGAFLQENGFITFRHTRSLRDRRSPFEKAFYLATEINRQAQTGIYIATFKLTKLERIK